MSIKPEHIAIQTKPLCEGHNFFTPSRCHNKACKLRKSGEANIHYRKSCLDKNNVSTLKIPQTVQGEMSAALERRYSNVSSGDVSPRYTAVLFVKVYNFTREIYGGLTYKLADAFQIYSAVETSRIIFPCPHIFFVQ